MWRQIPEGAEEFCPVHIVLKHIFNASRVTKMMLQNISIILIMIEVK